MRFKIVSNKTMHSFSIGDIVIASSPTNATEAAYAWFYHNKLMMMTEECLVDWVRIDEITIESEE